jgi:hypothetical protein
MLLLACVFQLLLIDIPVRLVIFKFISGFFKIRDQYVTYHDQRIWHLQNYRALLLYSVK